MDILKKIEDEFKADNKSKFVYVVLGEKGDGHKVIYGICEDSDSAEILLDQLREEYSLDGVSFKKYNYELYKKKYFK
jgi:hypothetical protein